MKEPSIFRNVKIIDNSSNKYEGLSEEMIIELSKVDELRPLYSDDFLSFIKKIIIDNKLYFEDIADNSPDANWVAIDERICRGIKCCFGEDQTELPISYMMVKSVIENGSLETVDDKMYYMTIEDEKYLPFTKEEFKNTIPYLKNQKRKGSK